MSLLPQQIRVPISECVHFCGFQYGRGAPNPYENYVSGLVRGAPKSDLRSNFIDFLRYYRPLDLGEALGISTRRSVPLWLLPWKSWNKLRRKGAWRQSLDEIVDILTYFSPAGIRYSRIIEEFGWLESALDSMQISGYLPKQHSFITVFELAADGESRYIVVDGNHRISALAALGETNVIVRKFPLATARRANASWWPLVLSGHVSRADALAIFDAYFAGNLIPYRSETPARVLPE
jgi:hypothetical protein